MIIPSSFLPAPGRLFLPGCAIAAGLLAVSSPVFAAPAENTSTNTPTQEATAPIAAPEIIRVGKTQSFPLLKLSTVRIEEGFANIFWEAKNETLTVKALSVGVVKIRIETPNRAPEILRLNLVEAKRAGNSVNSVKPSEPNAVAEVTTTGLSQIVQAPLPNANDITLGTAANPANSTGQQVPNPALVNPNPANPTFGAGLAGGMGTNLGTGAMTSTVPTTVPNSITGAMPLAPAANGGAMGTSPVTPSVPLAPSLPVLGRGATAVQVNNPGMSSGPVKNSAGVGAAPQISPNLPAPSSAARANVGYRTSVRPAAEVGASKSRPSIDVTQGLARIITFPRNILAVYFSDPNVMDARAINARTIAVTGVGLGLSTLAVFTSREPGDAVGRANVYNIQTLARGGQVAPELRNPRTVERTIITALGDPRVRTAIISLPDGSLAARLSGTVRSEAEVQAALTTARFFVPEVVSSLYADINAPTLDAVLSGASSVTPETNLQENLRRVTGNSSIELVSLPSGLAFKAEVNSVDEAQALLRVLPSLNQQVIPFIVIRGQDPASSPYYNSTVPLLNGEDRQLTQRLHDVTGINTVYAVRTASNAMACYGTVSTRTQYNTVRRFMLVMAQSAAPPALQGTSQGGSTLRPQGFEGPILPGYDPQGGYLRDMGLQMFVRITDASQSVIRKVTVETNIVEISRTSLKNLGLEYGSVSLTDEDLTPGTTTTTTVRDGAGNPVIDANGNIVTQTTGSAGVLTRQINPTFNAGTVLTGNGFSGLQSFRNLDPIRTRLNALVTNGDARILSRPNVTAVEGAAAQITIGGERPIPIVSATQGTVGTEITFRRYGVIISMRPTVTGENTILLQIRADVTQPDSTFGINLNNSFIPGEIVRSIDTTLNVRPGDTVVMGGLITNEKRQQMSKIPILGDLPIIGSLFRSKRFDNNETELAIFMSPRIESMPADMETLEDMNRIPSFPALPGRQDADATLARGSVAN